MITIINNNNNNNNDDDDDDDHDDDDDDDDNNVITHSPTCTCSLQRRCYRSDTFQRDSTCDCKTTRDSQSSPVAN